MQTVKSPIMSFYLENILLYLVLIIRYVANSNKESATKEVNLTLKICYLFINLTQNMCYTYTIRLSIVIYTKTSNNILSILLLNIVVIFLETLRSQTTCKITIQFIDYLFLFFFYCSVLLFIVG